MAVWPGNGFCKLVYQLISQVEYIILYLPAFKKIPATDIRTDPEWKTCLKSNLNL